MLIDNINPKKKTLMKNNTQNLTLTALMAAVLCIVGPWVIPIGMVPMSLTNMVIYLTIILLDKKNAIISVILYLLIGFVGLPVFSGFTGGAGKVFGPTGGYLIGYLVLCLIASGILEIPGKGKKTSKIWSDKPLSGEKSVVKVKRIKQILALTAGTLGLYLFGTLWLMFQSKLGFVTALSIGVLPFLPFDIGKIVAAVCLGNAVKKRIRSIR